MDQPETEITNIHDQSRRNLIASEAAGDDAPIAVVENQPYMSENMIKMKMLFDQFKAEKNEQAQNRIIIDF